MPCRRRVRPRSVAPLICRCAVVSAQARSTERRSLAGSTPPLRPAAPQREDGAAFLVGSGLGGRRASGRAGGREGGRPAGRADGRVGWWVGGCEHILVVQRFTMMKKTPCDTKDCKDRRAGTVGSQRLRIRPRSVCEAHTDDRYCRAIASSELGWVSPPKRRKIPSEGRHVCHIAGWPSVESKAADATPSC